MASSDTRHAEAKARRLASGYRPTRLDAVLAWARSSSLSPLPFATACCGPELESLAGPRYDAESHGLGPPCYSPRQADLLLVAGSISHRQAEVVRRVYDQMAEPKWVMAIGACACSGGPYDNYATVQGVDRILPVDVYVPGCPPRPEAVLDGLLALQARIRGERVGPQGRHAKPGAIAAS